jgi:hypothetical protein
MQFDLTAKRLTRVMVEVFISLRPPLSGKIPACNYQVVLVLIERPAAPRQQRQSAPERVCVFHNNRPDAGIAANLIDHVPVGIIGAYKNGAHPIDEHLKFLPGHPIGDPIRHHQISSTIQASRSVQVREGVVLDPNARRQLVVGILVGKPRGISSLAEMGVRATPWLQRLRARCSKFLRQTAAARLSAGAAG